MKRERKNREINKNRQKPEHLFAFLVYFAIFAFPLLSPVLGKRDPESGHNTPPLHPRHSINLFHLSIYQVGPVGTAFGYRLPV